MDKKGYFVVSLDFELMWGVHDVATITEYEQRLIQTRKAIPRLLDLFDKYSIHATWATVGLLFAKNKQELLDWMPPLGLQPSYTDQIHSNYMYYDKVGEDEEADSIHFGRKLIEQIRTHKGQEIGSHTFSHYYCLEKGQCREQFREDLARFQKIADREGLKVRSIIFPRNQCNKNYLAECKEYGFFAYRGMEKSYINSDKLPEKLKRYLRFIDSFVSIGGHHCYSIDELRCAENAPMNIRSSCFFRPYISNSIILERLKLSRIKRQMHHAAKHHKVFHIWWHPHNMGLNPEKMLDELEELFKYVRKLDKAYGFLSVNMGELSKNPK